MPIPKLISLKKFEGKTFNDFLIRERKSYLESRLETNLSSKFSRNIKLNIPISSAPMKDITESEMAIALARFGGIGIIHRDMNPEQQAEEIKKVKRKQNYIIEDPYTIEPQKTMAHVQI